LAVGFVMTGPVWWTEGAFVGDLEAQDLQGSVWAYWWSAFSLAHGLNPFEGGANFFPIGQDPVSQYNILDGLVSAPLIWTFGLRVGFNLACVGILASAGWGMWVLARAVGLSTAGALVAGVGLESSGFVLHHLNSGRPTQAMIVFFVLALAGLMHLAKGEGGRLTPVWTGMAVVGIALTYWYNAFFFLVAAIVLWFFNRKQLNARAWKRSLVAAVIALAVVLPFVYQLGQAFDGLPGVGRLDVRMDELSGLISQDYGLRAAIEGSAWPLWPIWRTPNLDGHSLSLLLLAFAGYAFWRRSPGGLAWGAVFGLGWLFSLGPFLRLGGGTPAEVPLPFLWVYRHVPFLDRLWWPGRWAILCTIALCVLAGMGVDQMRQRGRWESRRAACFLVLATLVTSFARNGGVFVRHSVLPFTDATLFEGLEGPVLSTPIWGDSETAGYVLLSQTQHGQAMNSGLGQHLKEHRPAGFDAVVEGNAVIAALVQLEAGGRGTALIQPEDVEALGQLGFRTALVDPAAYMTDMKERWAASYAAFFTALWGEPEHIAAGGAWWRIVPIEGPVEVPLMLATRPDRRLR
jgi:hypothetical protein